MMRIEVEGYDYDSHFPQSRKKKRITDFKYKVEWKKHVLAFDSIYWEVRNPHHCVTFKIVNYTRQLL
jgi:hypothetical protein